ncbi:unnamed protein product [Lasius platythorax]|uniref:Uncharacterized protein n=1 Tax=Lasius platythorax TaxID=488582 RepID=A0AAV2N156_9HYME
MVDGFELREAGNVCIHAMVGRSNGLYSFIKMAGVHQGLDQCASHEDQDYTGIQTLERGCRLSWGLWSTGDCRSCHIAVLQNPWRAHYAPQCNRINPGWRTPEGRLRGPS